MGGVAMFWAILVGVGMEEAEALWDKVRHSVHHMRLRKGDSRMVS